MDYDVIVTDGVITFKNPNTTLGFVRFNSEGEVEYIFVQPMYRRKGLAAKLLHMVHKATNKFPIPQEPISPYGKKLFDFYRVTHDNYCLGL